MQDTSQFKMGLSEDGVGLQINGNQWKALELPAPYNVTHTTLVEMDVVVGSGADFIMLCLDNDLEGINSKWCVSLQNPRDSVHHMAGEMAGKLVTGVPRRVAIPFGQFMNLGASEVQEVKYIAFVQDEDVGNKSGGRSTWSNIRFYEQERDPVSVSLFGQSISLANVQQELHSSPNDRQDNRDVVLSVSADGKTITATGNTWKYLTFPEPFNVTKDTVLKFDFDLSPPQGESHFLCLTDNDYINDNRKDCFATAGTQTSSVWTKVQPYNQAGTTAYEVLIGSYFTGPVRRLGFGIDNDANKLAGQSAWSNIEVSNLPGINLGLPRSDTRLRSALGIDSDYVSVKNVQLPYDQGQDTGPIRNNLAIVSEDGASITFDGNMWRAWELTTPMSPDSLGDFVVSFDFKVAEAGELHAICFDDNQELGDQDDPNDTGADPRRCVLVGLFQTDNSPSAFLYAEHLTPVGGSHRYVLNLSKMFDRFYDDIRYLAFVSDSDKLDAQGVKSYGKVTYSNIAIHAELDSCLRDTDFSFDLADCSIRNFLLGVGTELESRDCANSDPLLEMFAFFDATQETEVYEKIEKICSFAYESDAFDFTKTLSLTDQLVPEYIDGGTKWNYGGNREKEAAKILHVHDNFASSHVLKYPDHHALKHCDIGAAMCCFTTSKTAPVDAPAPKELNAEVCYTDIQASRYSAHVKDGYSIYAADNVDDLYCEGFAWGTDNGSIDGGLKGNELFMVGFMNEFYTNGNVEQVPAAPMCGCVDRMPVVTNAKCLNAQAASSSVTVSYNSALEDLGVTFTPGDVTYSECSEGNLLDHYKALSDEGKVRSEDIAYMESRIVGSGNCKNATNAFLATKGLSMA